MSGRAAALAFLVVASSTGCNLFETTNAENAAGRGPKAFDPYSGTASGALRLGLQMFNNCAILATGEPVGKGAANIPYPETCGKPGETRHFALPPVPPVNPAPPMPLLAGATYFLNQITLEEAATNLHTTPGDTAAVANWMKTQTRFAGLDWTNLGVVRDEYTTSMYSRGENTYDHLIRFGNASWQLVRDDTFLVEVLNADGQVVQSITYDRGDFLAESPDVGHTQLQWVTTSVGAPEYPGDPVVHPAPPAAPGGMDPSPTTFESRLRIDMILSTHPTESFKLDAGLVGDGAIRLTWSQLPKEPFYFPVTFVKQQDLPATCLKSDRTTKVACDFGLKPEVTFVPPQNGKFFVPGEQMQVKLAIKDGSGNYLHDPDNFPSWNQAYAGDSNGILYVSIFGQLYAGERDSVGLLAFGGPHHLQRPSYELNEADYLIAPASLFGIELAAFAPFPGLADSVLPTSQFFTIPADAKPGTYTAYFKMHRQFLGERFTKIGTADFQVGQAEKTEFPNRVGNCQICHRGTISLDNVRHGLPVDYVEGCKTCHNRHDPAEARIASMGVVHRLHMGSPKYPQQKNNCTFCHLTKESTLRPSYFVCSSCHPQPHGTEYWDLQFKNDADAKERGIFGNCAQQCHGQTPPTGHILPAQ